MRRMLDILLADLRRTISELGTDGGLISPSVYDTAQLLRLAPPEHIWPILGWLLEQQRSDGGWGDPAVPRTRDLPTLAAILAIDTYGKRSSAREAVQRGLAFMTRQASYWDGPLGDDITIGLELLLLPLLGEARRRGMKLNASPYAELSAMGERRRALIASRHPGPGSTPLHSWEGWGEDPAPSLIDVCGSIGHNPAATAAWLACAAARPGLEEARAAARAYLEASSRATGASCPGVVPTCWPLPRFEQVFGLQALHLGGLLDHPALADVVRPQIDALQAAFGTYGVGFSDHFIPDGDDTAAATAVLLAAGRAVSGAALQYYASGDHFCAYRHEMHASVSVTAHAIHTLRLLGQPTAPYEGFLIERQRPDGRWLGDKWNRSWFYTTWRCMAALSGGGRSEPVRRAVDVLLSYQHPDGGWGMTASNPEETGYVVLALRSLCGNDLGYDRVKEALSRGDAWLQANYQPFTQSQVACWIGKEPFSPLRVVRALELTALLSGLLARDAHT